MDGANIPKTGPDERTGSPQARPPADRTDLPGIRHNGGSDTELTLSRHSMTKQKAIVCLCWNCARCAVSDIRLKQATGALELRSPFAGHLDPRIRVTRIFP